MFLGFEKRLQCSYGFSLRPLNYTPGEEEEEEEGTSPGLSGA